ncbi:MAG: site-2 protease family protein, partial [Chloroflexota bacterium]
MENTSLLAFVIFVAVFAGVVLVHEFGHFVVARLFKIEVEEFGVGLPPKALVMWREKGHLFLKSGKRIEIPRDFGLPFPWSVLADREVTLTVDAADDALVLRSLEFSEPEQEKKPSADPMRAEQIHVDRNGT